MPGRTTKAAPLAMRSTFNSLDQFKTCDDAILEKMKAAALAMLQAMSVGTNARWLTFAGASGTGKTLLSELIHGEARTMHHLRTHKTLLDGVAMAFWPGLLSRLRNGEHQLVRDLCDANFVLLDEVAIEHDPSGFARDKLCEILSMRVGKWTVITSNLTLTQLGEIDTRISSRMVRGGSVVIACNTVDFADRRITT